MKKLHFFFIAILAFGMMVSCDKTPVEPEPGGGGGGGGDKPTPPAGIEYILEVKNAVYGYSGMTSTAKGSFELKSGDKSYTYQFVWKVDDGERRSKTLKPGDKLNLNADLAKAETPGEHKLAYGLRCEERTGSLVEGTETFYVCGAPIDSYNASYIPINDAVSTITRDGEHKVYIGQEGVIRFDYKPSDTVLDCSLSVVGDVVADITSSPQSNVAGRVEYGFKVKGEGRQEATFVFVNGPHRDEFKVTFVTVGALSGPTIVPNFYRNYIKGHDMDMHLGITDWERMDVPFDIELYIDGSKTFSAMGVNLAEGALIPMATSELSAGMHELFIKLSSRVAGVIPSEYKENFWIHDVTTLPVKTESGISELPSGSTLEVEYRSPVQVLIPESLNELLYAGYSGSASFDERSGILTPFRGESSIFIRNRENSKVIFSVTLKSSQKASFNVSALNDAVLLGGYWPLYPIDKTKFDNIFESLVENVGASVISNGFGPEESSSVLVEYDIDYTVFLLGCRPGETQSYNQLYHIDTFSGSFHGTSTFNSRNGGLFTPDFNLEAGIKLWSAWEQETERGNMPRYIWRTDSGEVRQDYALPGIEFKGARVTLTLVNLVEPESLDLSYTASKPSTSGAQFSVTLRKQ